jgi:hypothetical protein
MRFSAFKLQMLALAVALLVGAGFLQGRLNRQRADPKLGLTRVTPLENAPPVLAFTTVALGGFRGLIANALWIRANDLQQEDKFFEQVQLADWITKLEPHFTQVWLVQGWNMAYNISVKFRDPYDRWRWVQRGIELLRDDGLRYNPKEALIYRELAWFFQHKMGQNMDDAHLIYKYEWAKQMTNVLGGPRPNYDELLNPQSDTARQRVKLLREKYKMDPALMKKADELYGPLEWRLPDASAIYWAMVGLENSNKKDLTTLRRVIYQSEQTIVLRGRIILERPDGSFVFGPNLSKIPQANDGFEKMIAEETDKPDAIKKAHRNFLKEVVFMLYTHNRLTEANRWLAALKEKYPEAMPKEQTVEEFALQRMTSTITDVDHNRKKALIQGLLVQHFENLAIDEEERAAGLLQMARQIHQYYNSTVQRRPGVLDLPSFKEMYDFVRGQLLDPKEGLPPVYRDRLRTIFNLPATPERNTNAPPAVAPKSGQ